MPATWKFVLSISGVMTILSGIASLVMLVHGNKGDSLADTLFLIVVLGYILWLVVALMAAVKFNLVKWPVWLFLIHPVVSAITFFSVNWTSIFPPKSISAK
ncbi:MAG: hypothetical protein IPQ13_13840 [Holophagaceae bacterium]|nr:hypothetical protein [Holophagaceae bacterium]